MDEMLRNDEYRTGRMTHDAFGGTAEVNLLQPRDYQETASKRQGMFSHWTPESRCSFQQYEAVCCRTELQDRAR